MVDPVYKSLEFLEAILFFRGKVSIPTATWRSVLRESHDWAFVVAGATKASLLADLRKAVDKAISEGTTLAQFRKDFDQAVVDAGWNYKGSRGWRTEVIFRTNLRTAHAAGRYRQMRDPDLVERRPYWQYRHGGSFDPRTLHVTQSPAGWNGLVLRADDEFWQTHYPPNGWGCSCFVVSLSDADLQRLGLSVGEAPEIEMYEWVNPDTGEVEDVPVGIDGGWDYAPGASLPMDRTRIMASMLQRLPSDLRPLAEAAINTLPDVEDTP